MKRLRFALLVSLQLCLSAFAQVSITTPDFYPPPDRPRPQTYPWAVESRYVDMQVRNQVASVSVTETLLNTCGRMVEAEYYLPIPANASVDQLTLTVNGREMSGEILSADDARRHYESIVRSRRDPALLEYAGLGCIRVSAFPLEPNKPAQLSFHYNMLCPREGDVVELQFPLATARHSSAPVKEVRVSAEIQGQAELMNIYSPTLEIKTNYRGDRDALVTYTSRDFYPSADFVVYYREDNTELGATFLTYFPERGKDGYYMMLVSPARKASIETPLAKDILLVLDRSGSMAGEKIAQARDAARFVINNLNPEDRFDIITYNDAVESTFDILTSATEANRKTALSDVGRVESGGGTNIHDALETAMDILNRSNRQASLISSTPRPAYVFFLTDGLPTVGVTDEQQIINNTRAANDMQARLFCFGVGYDVNVRLLDNLSNDQKGKSAYVKPDEDIEVKVSSLYSKIKNPVMSGLQVDLRDFHLRDRQPSTIGDLFEGDQIVQVGRISNEGNDVITTDLVISGVYQGREETFNYPVEVNGSNHRSSYKFIEKLWAQRRVAFLLNEIRLKGNVEELVDEITELATRYGIVTPYTSYLADENQRLSARHEIRLDVASKSKVLHRDVKGIRAQEESMAMQEMEITKQPGYKVDPDGSLHVRGGRSTEARYNVNGIQTTGERYLTERTETMRQIGGEIFYKRGEFWILSSLAHLDLEKDAGQFTHVKLYSDDYFALLKESPAEENALLSGQRDGEKFVVSLCGQAYIIE